MAKNVRGVVRIFSDVCLSETEVAGREFWLKMPDIFVTVAGDIFSGVAFLEEVSFLRTEVPLELRH